MEEPPSGGQLDDLPPDEAELEAEPDPEAVEDLESAARPVDLRSDLESGLDPVSSDSELASRMAQLADEAIALAALESRSEERPILAELARRLRQGEVRFPSMPQAVVRVQRLVDSGRCSLAELAAEIELDPALTTRLVGIANSPFYRMFEPVPSLADAVVRIGLGETRNIVLAVMLRSRVFRARGHDAQVGRLWEHSVAASTAAQVIGAAVGEDPDSAFLLGLLHDIGRVVLLCLVSDVEHQGRARVRVSEPMLRHLDALLHARLGAFVAQSWRIDPALVEAIAYHHTPGDAEVERNPMVRVARCADLMAHRIDGDAAVTPVSEQAFEAALADLGFDRDEGEALQREAFEILEARNKNF